MASHFTSEVTLMAQLNLYRRAIYIQLLKLMQLRAAARVIHDSESFKKLLHSHTKLFGKYNMSGLHFIWLKWIPLIQK